MRVVQGFFEMLKRRRLMTFCLLFSIALFILSFLLPEPSLKPEQCEGVSCLKGVVTGVQKAVREGREEGTEGPEYAQEGTTDSRETADPRVAVGGKFTLYVPGTGGTRGTRVLCSTEGMLPGIGDRVTVLGTVTRPRGARNPGSFDYREYLRSKGIFYLFSDATVRKVNHSGPGFMKGLNRFSEQVRNELYRYFDDSDAGIMIALLLGDKSLMEDELTSLYKRGGILHVLALSGLHVNLLSEGVELLLFPLLKKRSRTGPCALLFVYGWCILAGMPVGMVRAALMTTVRVFGCLMGRSPDTLTSLSLSMGVLMFFNPYVLCGVAMQYSFLAVFGLTVLGGLVPRSLKFVGSSLCATSFTLPVTLLNYYGFNPYQVMVNLPVLLLMPFLLAGGGLVVLFGLPGFTFIAGGCAYLSHMLLKLTEGICRLFLKLPFSYIITGSPGTGRVLLYLVLILGGSVLYYLKRGHVQKEGQRVLLFCAAVMLPGVLFLFPHYKEGVVYADVGQGDCILIMNGRGDALLTDCGSTSEEDIFLYTVEPMLHYYGIKKLGGVILTHADKDHISGMTEFFTGDFCDVKVQRLLLPKGQEAAFADLLTYVPKETRVGYLQRGDRLSLPGIWIQCLHPGLPGASLEGQEKNEMSTVLSVTFESGFGTLLTGDISMETEQELLPYVRSFSETADIPLVLKVPHHGSRYSCGAELLLALKPQAAVISVGYNNYGHPSGETLERLSRAGCPCFITKKEGAVLLFKEAGSVKIKGFIE